MIVFEQIRRFMCELPLDTGQTPTHIILGTDTYKRVRTWLNKNSDYAIVPDHVPIDESFRLFGYPVLVVTISEYVSVGYLKCTQDQQSSSQETDSQGQ